MKKQAMRLLLALCLAWMMIVGADASERMLIPGGYVVGIRLDTGGPVITGFEKGSPARAAGLRKGDVITAVDGIRVQTASQLRDKVGEDQLVLTVLRSGKQGQFCVVPAEEKLGIYVRDAVAGIGTVTYCDPQTGCFGALGHGVNDRDTTQLLQSKSGVVVHADVDTVEKGTCGKPGELRGAFDLQQALGKVTRNTEQGIFGEFETVPAGRAMQVAKPEDVEKGAAAILANVQGEKVERFSVEILEIHPQRESGNRNLLLKITDDNLLQKTGGIVQGMSGSPIIQDGKLVGAVTHVLVNDPTRGYGIFIENMLRAAG